MSTTFRKYFRYARMTSLKIKRLISLLLLAVFMRTLRQLRGLNWAYFMFNVLASGMRKWRHSYLKQSILRCYLKRLCAVSADEYRIDLVIYKAYFNATVAPADLFFPWEKRALVLVMLCFYLWTCCLNSVKRSTNGRITIFPPTLLRLDNIDQKYITFWACPSANGAFGNFLFFLWGTFQYQNSIFLFSLH